MGKVNVISAWMDDPHGEGGWNWIQPSLVKKKKPHVDRLKTYMWKSKLQKSWKKNCIILLS